MESLNNISPDRTSGQILHTFYKEHDLPPDGGVNAPRVKIKMAKGFAIYIPNFDARRKVILRHDIHHLLTGYSTHLKGETEIGAWEIGSGCRHYWAAWALDMSSMMLGFWFNLGGIFRAFVRGRHSTNLYSDIIDDKKVVDMPISEIHKVIKIPSQNEKIKATPGDIASFLWNLFIGGVYDIASIALIPFVIIYNIVVFVKLSVNH